LQVEIRSAPPDDPALRSFWRAVEREALRTFWGFTVVWHEQVHEFVALDGERIVGALRVHIAASLARLQNVVVVPDARRRGIGRELLTRCEETANYYNCHKVTLEVPVGLGAQSFFESCGYRVDAILPQHTFKLDVAVLRKFLL
jgi:ribosomal protein S18 acetylase RimI-like enzyme